MDGAERSRLARAAAMITVARDETRHAALAWQVHAWSSGLLDALARARIAEARTAAVRELADELARPQPATLMANGLVPPAPTRVALLRSLEAQLSKAAA